MIGVDFADPDRGLAASIRSGAVILFDHEDVLAAAAHSPLELDGDEGGEQRASLAIDGSELELELTPVGNTVKLEGETIPAEELVACRVLGKLRHDGNESEIACLGIRSSSADPDWERIERHRSLAVAFSDGGLLALSASLPAGASGHGDEEVVAALTGSEGEAVSVEEALLSTEFDAEGRQRRATLELWPAGDALAPLRAGGAIVCGASVVVGELRLDTAFFRWSMDGRPGLGRYEVIRRG